METTRSTVTIAETGLEVERRGAPERPPPAREDLGAGAIDGGEQRYDAAKNLVGEAAEQVGGVAVSSSSSSSWDFFSPPPPLASGILLRHPDLNRSKPWLQRRNSGRDLGRKIIASEPNKAGTPSKDLEEMKRVPDGRRAPVRRACPHQIDPAFVAGVPRWSPTAAADRGAWGQGRSQLLAPVWNERGVGWTDQKRKSRSSICLSIQLTMAFFF